MEISVKIDQPSSVTRKLTITIPGPTIKTRYGAKLVEVQRRAKLKGFREGKVPLNLVKQYYQSDVRQAVFNSLIDDSINQAFKENKIRAVGQPVIENSPDQAPIDDLEQATEFKFVATVEIFPEVEIKDYKNLTLTRDAVKVTDDDVQGVIKNIQNNFAQLSPVERSARLGDFVDFEFQGEVKNDQGEMEKPKNLGGRRFSELGTKELLDEFEAALVGVKASEDKVFELKYPEGYPEKELAGKDAQFSIKVHEVKEKSLPTVDDELAKQAGYESVEDMKKKAHDFLLKNKTEDADRKLRSEGLQALIDKNPVEVPQSLVSAQMQEVAREYATSLEREGFTQKMIEEALQSQKEFIQKRAENQVKAGLVLHAISKKESIEVTDAIYDEEIKKFAVSMNQEEKQVREFFDKNASRKDNFRFHILEELTLNSVLQRAKIKEAKA